MAAPPIPPPTPDAKTLPESTIRRNPRRRVRNQIPPSAAAPHPIHELTGDPPKPHDRPAPENLRVFLRIRPLEPKHLSRRQGDAASDRARHGGAAQKAKPKRAARNNKGSEPFLVVNGTSSVTLAVSQTSLIDPKRAKTEVYDGFGHVFPADSTQNDVYEKVMSPLVQDFMGGKSGLLAAMGPTGSGKTYTMFGSPRNPGMVSLALQEIFSHGVEDSPTQERSYYFSIFEICCERGKGERIIDLSPSGTEAFLQQSAIRGLQEIMVSSAVDAECLIARGMLKRATSTTNANRQSSRSQCVINIRRVLKVSNGELDIATNAVLTVIDLAGAERERKTNNQGAKLMESGFINNTSMVFGLCLRSLMEHQKNPKKQLEKHFQNSLLTRYLKDYLEGKKRFTLILTVKQGELDYPETSCLLRQASPYMQIKFPGVEVPNLPCRKRSDVYPRLESAKRRNCSQINETSDNIRKQRDGAPSGVQVASQTSPKSDKKISSPPHSMVSFEEALPEGQYAEIEGLKRSQQIMCRFSRALWKLWKQNKQKLEASESELHAVKESLMEKNSRVSQLEKELQNLRLQSLHDENVFQEAPSTPKAEEKSDCHPDIATASLSEAKAEPEASAHVAQSIKLSCSELKVSAVDDGDSPAEVSAKKSLPISIHNHASKPPQPQKPRRQLIPASSMLLVEFGGADVENIKGSEIVEKKQVLGNRQRSRGSMALLRLLRSPEN